MGVGILTVGCGGQLAVNNPPPSLPLGILREITCIFSHLSMNSGQTRLSSSFLHTGVNTGYFLDTGVDTGHNLDTGVDTGYFLDTGVDT